MKSIAGHCHCGAVRFEVAVPIPEFTRCDCSLCTMRAAVMARVPEAGLVVTRGQDRLSTYRWNTRIAVHFFCGTCGIYVFHRKRAMPDHFGVNARCLEGIDLAAIAIRPTSGACMTVVPGAPTHWTGPIE